MQRLPSGISAYKRTPHFTQESIPPGLLSAHSTKPGIWGLIVIVEGELLYRILEPNLEEIRLSPRRFGVVEPTVRHEVVAIGNVEFYVEFLRERTV